MSIRSRSRSPGGQDVILLLSRVLLSLLFLIDGVGKLKGFDGTLAYLVGKQVPLPEAVAVLTILIEAGGGALVLLGGGTRSIAWVMAFYCLATAFVGHPFWTLEEVGPRMNQTYHFWKNVGLCGAFLLLQASGPGCLSLDAWLARRSAAMRLGGRFSTSHVQKEQ